MGKNLFIAEKPSVAREFANALKYNMRSKDGYLESEEAIVTWCVGHLELRDTSFSPGGIQIRSH